jgi:hypothetical protein
MKRHGDDRARVLGMATGLGGGVCAAGIGFGLAFWG